MDEFKQNFFLVQYQEVWKQRNQHVGHIWAIPAIITGLLGILALLIAHGKIDGSNILFKIVSILIVVVGFVGLFLRHNFFIKVLGLTLKDMAKEQEPDKCLPQFGDEFKIKYERFLNPGEQFGSWCTGTFWWAVVVVGLVLFVLVSFLPMSKIFDGASKQYFWNNFFSNVRSEAFLDIGYILLKILFLLSITWITLVKAKDEWTKRKRKLAIPLFIIGVGLFFPLLQSFQDILWPVVSSGKVSFEKKDLEYIEPLKQYRMVFHESGGIEDVDVFYTSYYDENGRHIARMNWVKYIDFRFADNYIQSNHELNNGEGEHTVVFKNRVPLWKYPSAKRKAEMSLNF